MYQDFDPKKHKPGVKLFEIKSREVGDVIETYYDPADVDYQTAAKTPWFYVVKVE